MRKIIIQGIKFDEKSSYQKGPKLAPPLIREALNCGSANMYTENVISIENSILDDKGDFEISEYFDIEKITKKHLNSGGKIFTLGGDHSITFPIIKAHNEKDLKTIESINDDSFKGYPPNGDIIDGSKAHIGFLEEWFTNSSPKWRTKYMIANEFTDNKGVLNQWVTSGQDLTDTVDGEEVTVHHVHDALFVNGKIKMIYVYERAKANE